MTSLIFLVVLKVLGLYCIPTKFHCSQRPNGRVKLGGGFIAPPVQNRVRPDPVQNRVKKILNTQVTFFLIFTSKIIIDLRFTTRVVFFFCFFGL